VAAWYRVRVSQDEPEVEMETLHVVAVIGGAVAGSEAAALAAARGALVIVIEQNVRPYGKIEDGLPRWHVALRQKEYGRIDANLDHPNILYVPCTRLGEHLELSELIDELGVGTVILANGAWRDRRIASVEGIERFEGRGLIYQNDFVRWFNQHPAPGYDGAHLEPRDGALVIGGGLASIDVVKILNLEVYSRALATRGIEVDVVALEHAGIPKVLEANGLTPEALGVEGCTLFYRRGAEDMPLATDDDPTPERLERLKKTRVKILDKVMRKYLVRFEPFAVAHEVLVDHGKGAEEGERLAGLVFRRTRQEGRRVVAIPGTEFAVPSRLVVSSIGSLPEPLPGIAMRGDVYGFEDADTGELDAARGIYGLGNVLTGRGNIKESRQSARTVVQRLSEERLAETLEVSAGSDRVHTAARREAEAAVAHALALPALSKERLAGLRAWVARRWEAVGYGGDYMGWIRDRRPWDYQGD